MILVKESDILFQSEVGLFRQAFACAWITQGLVALAQTRIQLGHYESMLEQAFRDRQDSRRDYRRGLHDRLITRLEPVVAHPKTEINSYERRRLKRRGPGK